MASSLPLSPRPGAETAPFLRLLAHASRVDIEEVAGTATSTPVRTRVPSERSFLIHLSGNEADAERNERLRLLENAHLLIEDEDFVLARGVYSFLLRRDRRDVDALRGIGECFLALGNTNSARRCFEALPVERFGDEQKGFLARCHAAEGSDSLATSEFDAIRDASTLPHRLLLPLWRAMASCFARNDQWERAADCLRGALTLRPDSDALLCALAVLELERGRAQEAEMLLRSACVDVPMTARVHFAWGLWHERRDALEDAERSLVAALEIDPMHVGALRELLVVAERRGSWTASRDALLRYLENEPTNVEMRFALATTRVRNNDIAAAIADLQFLLSQTPSHERAAELLNAIRPQNKAA